MADSLAPTIDSDDEREIVTVGEDEDIDLFSLNLPRFTERPPPIINHLKKPWSCAACPRSFTTKEGATDHAFGHCHGFYYDGITNSYVKKRNQIEQYIQGVFECSICKCTYNGGKQRPRTLPCNHGFCTQCIELRILQKDKSCAICRTCHGANSADELPVNILLEIMLNKVNNVKSRLHESDLIPEQRIVYLIHDIKALQISRVQNEIKRITPTEKEIKALYKIKNDDINEKLAERHKLEEEVKLLLIKIEILNQEISRKQKAPRVMNNVLQKYGRNKRVLENLESSLKGTATNHIIKQGDCHVITNTIKTSQKLEESLRKEVDLVKQGTYTESKRSGILFGSNNDSITEKAISPKLSIGAKPSVYASLIIDDKMELISATSTTVFLDFSANGNDLGRVYIHVLSNRDRGKQFVALALGINGQTLKGANFAYRLSNRIQLMDFITEDNPHASVSVVPVENEDLEEISKGSLYKCGNGCFQIFTENRSNCLKGCGYFGYVTAGLHVIDRAASNEFIITDIAISNCGVVLGY